RSRRPPARRSSIASFVVSVDFFFSSYGDPRDLHSFPTRRSSDLDQQGAAPATDKDELEIECSAAAPLRAHEDVAKRAAEYMRPRSEEHTSELQSLAYLVCRLLLEKKKKTQTRYQTLR